MSDWTWGGHDWDCEVTKAARGGWYATVPPYCTCSHVPALPAIAPAVPPPSPDPSMRSLAWIIRAFTGLILHGDEKHRAWLLAAAEEFIATGAVRREEKP